ncbi:trihelix transcription factor ASR3-like [Aristolochia californica]|uniref:trihelix transcription factor ASR3-like n=1 Tax=Aristolochia californica TaxID=171875 RepID=UPI0035DDD133
MADPLTPSPTRLLDHHHNHEPQPQPHSQPRLPPSPTTSPAPYPREYRKGNWTLRETLVLITAKKLDDERRSGGTAGIDPNKPSSSSCKSAELRWKWVENYCWAHGCLRSQNQCNDKWDNLLRDYKKVREYQLRSDGGGDHSCPPYWKLEKLERKERNLPTNLALEVFEALQEVVSRKQIFYAQKTTTSTPAAATLPPPLRAPPSEQRLSAPETTDSSETEGRDQPDSDTKRRRVRTLGSSIIRSASVLSQTLLACEEKKEKRHRDVLELEERKLQMEENRTEANRQGIAGLISAVNNLSSAIHTLVSDRNDTR